MQYHSKPLWIFNCASPIKKCCKQSKFVMSTTQLVSTTKITTNFVLKRTNAQINLNYFWFLEKKYNNYNNYATNHPWFCHRNAYPKIRNNLMSKSVHIADGGGCCWPRRRRELICHTSKFVCFSTLMAKNLSQDTQWPHMQFLKPHIQRNL